MRHRGVFLGRLSLKHHRCNLNGRYFSTNQSELHLISGDSTKRETYKQILERLGGNKADILVTDPPYCLLERKKLNGETRDDKLRKRKTDNSIEVPRYPNLTAYREFTKKWLSLVIECGLKPKANLIIWSNPLGKEIISSVCKDLRYQLIGEYLWLKKSSDKGTQETLLRCYESALIFAKDVAQENKEIIEVCGRSKKRYDLPWSVVSSYHDNSQPHPHPCHKPAIVLKPLLSTWTRHGDVILDPFAGSGGVPLALKELDGGRKYVGIEILDQWVLAANRSLQSS